MYNYKAEILRVVDADTLRIRCDLGLNIFTDVTVRLWGIDAPELSTVDGKAAKAFVESMCPVGSIVEIETIKDKREKYGRYLVRVYVQPALFSKSLNTILVDNGHAIYRNFK